MKITTRSTVVLAAWLLVQPLAMVTQAQTSPGVIIDRILRSDSSASSTSTIGSTSGNTTQYQQLLGSFKKWMGRYQRIQTDGDNYIAIFDSGSLPIEVRSKSNGSIESLNFGCPSTRSLSLNEAPSDIQRALLKCSGFNKSDR